MHGLIDFSDVKLAGVLFQVSQAEIVPETGICSPARFTCLSPFVVTRPSLQKYSPDAQHTGDISITFEPKYVLKRQGKITKLIKVNFSDDEYPIPVKSILSPFIMEGDENILRFAHEAGLGIYTDFGFGMLDHIA